MNLSNVITIYTVCDNHFSVLLAALIKSIDFNHHSREHINFYIVGDNLSPANKENLVKCARPDTFTFFFIDVNTVIKDQTRLPLDSSSFPLIVYIRLFFPLFLPTGISKVIYLDADMIVLKDISLLWNIELGDKIIAGVPDRFPKVSYPNGGIPNYKELNIDPETKYFNSGLLLINCSKWIEANITEQILDCINRNKKYARFPDQYGLNVVFANQWLELDSRWNCYPMFEKEDPYLIHFIDIKPIFTSYNFSSKYRDEFYTYLHLTPWAAYKSRGNYVRLFKKLRNKLLKKGYSFLTAFRQKQSL